MAEQDDTEKSPLLKSTESNRSIKLTEFARLPEENETKGRKWTKLFTPSVNISLTLLITAAALLALVAIYSSINHSVQIDDGDEELFNSTNFNTTEIEEEESSQPPNFNTSEIEESSQLPNLLQLSPNSKRNEFAETDDNEPVRKSPIVRISQGRLEGRIEKSRKGREYFAFYSVPYGKPPTGSLRFQPPQPAERWSRRSVRDAGQVKTQCITKDKVSHQVVGSEDCLHLHIWTPKLPEGSRRRKTKPNLPVLVYIYGGGFMTGTVKRFKASYMMDEDVILVIMDYRLGAFGHLNTGDLNARGNLSIRDQILALEWIQQNIEKFGGDVNRVLLVGSSSGSMSVHTILLSEMSQGLFQAAVCQSGVILSPNGLSALVGLDPKKSADIVAQHVNCPTNDTKEQVSCLQNVNASLIAEAVDLPGIFWGPTLEALPEDGNLSDVLLAENPMTLLREGRFNKVPLHLGVNSAEEYGAAYDLLRTPEDVQNLNENWTNLMLKGKLFMYTMTPEDLLDLSSDIKAQYFDIDDNENETMTIDKKHKDSLTDLLSDRLWIHPTRVAARFHIQHAPVYLHYFTKEPIVSLFDSKKDGFDKPHRAGHGDQVQFLFPYTPFPEIPLGHEFTEFSQDFVKIWVSIANNTGVPDGLGVESWEAAKVEDNGLTWFNIDDKPLRKNIQPFTERMSFWDDIPLEVLYLS